MATAAPRLWNVRRYGWSSAVADALALALAAGVLVVGVGVADIVHSSLEHRRDENTKEPRERERESTAREAQ